MVSESSFEGVTDGERNTDPDWTFANDDLEKNTGRSRRHIRE